MTGPEHYREAEQLMAAVVEAGGTIPAADALVIAQAQVHATLALAAATAFPAIAVCHGADSEPVRDEARQWSQVTS